MKTYTLEELKNKTDREFFTAAEICGVMKMDPNTIRLCAKQKPELLGVPVIITGTRVKFPRIPFLRCFGINI